MTPLPPEGSALLHRRLQSRSFPLEPGIDPLDLADGTGFVWLGGGRALVTRGAALRLALGAGPDRMARLAEDAGAALAAIEPVGADRPVAVGALPFDQTSPGELVVPELAVWRGADGAVQATVTGTGERLRGFDPGALRPARPARPAPWPRITAVRMGQDGAGWRTAVGTVLAEIAAGRLGKAVLAREVLVQADRGFSRAAVLGRLRERAAGSFVYAHGRFVGASPELLVARQGRLATSQPMAGTIPRSGSPAADARRETHLRSSAKDSEEHRFVVDAVVEALAGAGGQVEVGPAELVRLATVTHLATTVTARLDDPPPSVLDLVARLHPTPAVAGTPRPAALALLAELEPFNRGAYSGPVGWMDAAGDGEWAVALRCAELDGRSARLLAGAGIVAGSDPGAEWAETEAKLAAMLDVLTGA